VDFFQGQWWLVQPCSKFISLCLCNSTRSS
jgi:hypothetical protein